MPLDDTEKKLLCMANAPTPGERANTIEALHAHQVTIKHFCRDFVHELENAVPLSDYQALDALYQQCNQFNGGLVQQLQVAQTKLIAYQRIFSLKRHWQKLAAGVALPVLGLIGYVFYTADTAAVREARDAGFQRIAEATLWQKTNDDSVPVARDVAGVPYWLTVRRDEDHTGYWDSTGHPVTVLCVRLFAKKALPGARVYHAENPYTLWGWGWLTWPQVAVDCKPEPMRSAGR